MKYPAQGKLLKDLRFTQDLTLKQMGIKTGINPIRLHRMESGKNELTLREAAIMVRIFGMRVFDRKFLNIIANQPRFNKVRK